MTCSCIKNNQADEALYKKRTVCNEVEVVAGAACYSLG